MDNVSVDWFSKFLMGYMILESGITRNIVVVEQIFHSVSQMRTKEM